MTDDFKRVFETAQAEKAERDARASAARKAEADRLDAFYSDGLAWLTANVVPILEEAGAQLEPMKVRLRYETSPEVRRNDEAIPCLNFEFFPKKRRSEGIHFVVSEAGCKVGVAPRGSANMTTPPVPRETITNDVIKRVVSNAIREYVNSD